MSLLFQYRPKLDSIILFQRQMLPCIPFSFVHKRHLICTSVFKELSFEIQPFLGFCQSFSIVCIYRAGGRCSEKSTDKLEGWLPTWHGN